MKIITLTSGRPKAFAQLVKYVANQTYDNHTWLIVSDDWDSYKFPSTAQVIKRDNKDDTLPSLNHNLLVALEHLDGDKKFCLLEDDDWYHPAYLSEMNKMLDRGDLAGFYEDAYYYVMTRQAKRWHNQENLCSLAATGFTRKVIPFLKECASKDSVFIDGALWGGWTGSKCPLHNFTGLMPNQYPTIINDRTTRESGNIKGEHPRHVGLKTNWHGGKEGLSSFGHTPTGAYDRGGGNWLKKWLGDDAEFYLKITEKAYTYDERHPPMGIMIHQPADIV